jgi:hypothetical protein
VLDTLEEQQRTLVENKKNLNDIEVMSWDEVYVELIKEQNNHKE